MPFWKKSASKAAREQLSHKSNVSVGSAVPRAPQSKEANLPVEYCTICISLDFEGLFYSAEKNDIRLPNRLLTHLRASKSCPFCRLTLVAVQDHPALRNQDEEHGVIGLSQRSDQEPHFPITYNRAIAFWVYKITAGTLMGLPSVPHTFGIRALSTTPRADLPRNRDLLKSDTPPKSDIHRGQIVDRFFDSVLPQWWLKRCEEQHDKACVASPSSFDFGLKVIDVELGSIVNAPPACSYAALSYVWGNVKQLELRKDTRKWLMSPGSLRHGKAGYKGASGLQPSVTIRDAILLCRQLNFRYLWVDALCIEQDSEDRMIQIQSMGSIYLGASLTIVAASGTDANAGLFGVAGGTLRTPCQHLATLRGVPAVTILPNYEESMGVSHWRTRGWTFQEEMLSHRCLIVTERQLLFRCSSAIWCEDAFYEPTALIPDTDLFTLAHIDSTGNSSGFVVLNEPFSGSYSMTMRIGFYNDYIQRYTSRNITNPEDRLNAISGVLQALSRRTDVFFQTYFGIPRVTFSYSLCWTTKYHRPDRRVSKYPSWSWAGWLAPVKYDTPFAMEYIGAEGYDMIDPNSGQPFNATWFNCTGNTLSFVTHITKLRVSRERSTFNPIDEISVRPLPQDPSNAIYDVYSPRNELIGRIMLSSAWRDVQRNGFFFITMGPDTKKATNGEITRQNGVNILCVEFRNGFWYRVQMLRPILPDPRIFGTPIYQFSRKQWNAWTDPQKINISMG
ncbi:MAG: hypothetical protein Q9170_000591 [Blastenia crenularia]